VYTGDGSQLRHDRSDTETETGQQKRQERDGQQPGRGRIVGQPAKDAVQAIKIWYTNARSLPGKIDELRATAASEKPDIILINETWCNSENTDAELAVDGYYLDTDLRRDRTDTINGLGGGLIIYTKTGLATRKLELLTGKNFNQFSAFTVLAKNPLHLILIYRPPNSGRENIEQLCQIMESAPENSILIGDFNLPEIDWTNKTAGRRGRPILDAAINNNYEQMVSFPTHSRGNILDLVLTNCPARINLLEEAGKLGNSDHVAIEMLVDASVEKVKTTKTCKQWKRANYQSMRSEMDVIRWEEELRDMDAESAWKKFRSVLDDCVEKHVPTIEIYDTGRPKWLTKDIVKLIRQKKKSWKTYKTYGTAEARERYEKLEKEVKNRIRKAKRKLEKDLARSDDNNGKKFTAYIKSKTKSKSSIGPLKREDGTITTDCKEMAEILNKYMASVFTKENTNNVPRKQKETRAELSDVTITRKKIEEKIDSLKSESAPGPDGIHPKLLKEMKKSVSTPLQIIFRKSLDSGMVPADWRTARVVPIFKKGARGDPGNYRPVSLTSVPCKLLESIIKDDIMEHLSSNNLIKNSQHGFLPGRSCTTNLTIFLDTLTKITDKGKAADVFYLDFSKAFDKVPRERLLTKMEAKGITGKLLMWVRAWLENRTQRVVVGGSESSESKVESGVPQGTLLGPPLFTIYIDDLDEMARLVELIIKFADDTKGLKEIETDADRQALQDTLDSLCEWARTWAMSFNIPKCKIMHVGRSNPRFKYYMEGEELKSVEEEIDIGVVIHNSLKPGRQCERAANTAGAVLKLLQRNFHYRDRKVFMMLYKRYVRPHLEFSAPAWSPWTRADIDRIESVQKRAVGMVSGLTAADYEGKCREIGLQTLEERRIDQDMAQVYRFKEKTGGIVHNLFETFENRPGAVTRAAGGQANFKQQAARGEIRKNAFAVRTVSVWNGLPEIIKTSRTCDQFKRNLKHWRENGARPI
jgi:hypothetical protein